MATLQELKKKLKAIRSTEKLTKAMKTVSSVKYSKLNRFFSEYRVYSESCFNLYQKYAGEINSFFPDADPSAPPALFVFSSNRGLCGGFNTEVLNFAAHTVKKLPVNTLIFPCSKKSLAFFAEKAVPTAGSFIFSEVPDEKEAEIFLDEILNMRSSGKISSVYVIYPKYINVMKQEPVLIELFTAQDNKSETAEDDSLLFIPDKKTVMESIAKKIIFSSVFSVLSETALGAQAATLTAMRSAYDTAVTYSAQLEIQINRKRQSEVTADVIETSGGNYS